MLIPIDERMATRAHAVFDVVYAKNLNIINIDSHVNRLFKSAETVKIDPPMDKEETTEVIETVMSELVKKLISEGRAEEELVQDVFGIRLCISSGYGDFGITSIVLISLYRIKNLSFT